MTVSEIRVFPVGGGSQLKAKANVTLHAPNGIEISIKGLRIHDDGVKAPWVGVPTERYQKNGKTEYAEMLWINSIGQSEIYPKVLAAYKGQIKS